MIGRHILVLAPHPDDEVVGAATAILRAVADGARVSVLFLTTGVSGTDSGKIALRRREAEAVLARLGAQAVEASDRPSRTLKAALPQARAEVMDVLARTGADRLWVPAYEGGHQDHDAASALGWSLRAAIEVWEFAEYGFCGGRIQTNRFPVPRSDEVTLELTEAERSQKRHLLGLYRSERGNLGYVGVEHERFRRHAGYDYGAPPHLGRTFYQRFQWVPFRHPRIDFTTPAEVSVALCHFLARFPLPS